MALNKTLSFDLELKPGGIPPIIHASQGDIGRMFKANIYWDGSAATSYVSGATVNLRGKKPDKTVFDYTATLAGSMVTFETTEQMTIISGPVECELVFSNDGDIIASANFLLIVEASPYDPNAISESEVQGLNAMIQAATPEAVADWFETEAATSETFTDAVDAATLDYIDDHGVTVKQGSILPSLDKLTRATTFTNFCPMVKGTVNATVTDGTRWKTNGAVRVETLDNMLFTLNEGYKAMIYIYGDVNGNPFAQLTGKPSDANGWLTVTGTRRISEMPGTTTTHREKATVINIVIAAANGTDVITEEQARAAFKLETIKTTPLQKVGEAKLSKTGSTNGAKWYFNIPVKLTPKVPFSVFIRSNSSTPLPYTYFRCGSIYTNGSQNAEIYKYLTGEDLSNGYLITVFADYRYADFNNQNLLLYTDTTAGDFTPGTTIELYADPSECIQLSTPQYAVHNRNTVVVAAANTQGKYARTVDFFCDGVNDEVEIQAAVNLAAASNKYSGTVLLLDGDYYIESFTEYESTKADRPAAVLIPKAAKVINIEGATGENGTVLNIKTDNITEQVDVFGLEVQGTQGTIVNYSNLRAVVADQEHPLIVFDNYYTAACEMKHIRMYCLGYGAGQMPVEGLIGIRCSRGSNNGVGQELRHIGATGFYEAFQLGGEHLVCIDLLGRNNYYAYTFGNYDINAGNLEHPYTLINCADEFSAALPYFGRNGRIGTNYLNDATQQVDLIGFNMEIRRDGNPTQAEPLPAEEEVPGTFCGRVEFTATRNYNLSTNGNMTAFQFWKAGSGERFRTSNMTHKLGGTTTERNTYTPQYMQTYFDTTLSKMLVYDGTQWRDMNGTAV